MAQKNKALIVVGSIVVIGSIGYYLYSKSKATSKGGSSEEPTPNDAPTPTPTPTPSPKPSLKSKSPKISDYLNSTQTIQAFQDWMDANHPNWVNGKNLNKGAGYGKYIGKNTRKAWENHGTEYASVVARRNQDASARTNVNNIKKAFPIGKSVIALTTFRAFAHRFRNGAWFNTDANGNSLPSREFKATSVVGKVVTVDKDGGVIVQISPPIKNISGEFSQIKVRANLIK